MPKHLWNNKFFCEFNRCLLSIAMKHTVHLQQKQMAGMEGCRTPGSYVVGCHYQQRMPSRKRKIKIITWSRSIVLFWFAYVKSLGSQLVVLSLEAMKTWGMVSFTGTNSHWDWIPGILSLAFYVSLSLIMLYREVNLSSLPHAYTNSMIFA